MKKIAVLCALLALVTAGCSLGKKNEVKPISIDEAKVKVVNFINNNLVPKGSEVSIKEVIEENGLYKVTVNMANGQEVVSYLSMDGKNFFPQAMDIDTVEKQNAETKTQDSAAAKETVTAPKSAKPVVEAFVMSYCPYGTQIEKGLVPVAEALGNKIDFKIKFCDYAMHGQKELNENLIQYCIQKNEPTKFYSYLKCFLSAEDKSDACVKEVKINEAKLKTCVSDTDKQYKVTEKYNDKSTWSNGTYPTFDVNKADNTKYGVGGSPTLVINGETISSARDSASLLKTICAAFDKEPSECQKALSSETPAPGFGTGTSDSSGGGCGQ